MKQTIARYRVKPDQGDANEALVRDVFDELHETTPEGIRYATTGSRTASVSSTSRSRTGTIGSLAAFERFRERIGERCEEQPEASAATEVGSYP